MDRVVKWRNMFISVPAGVILKCYDAITWRYVLFYAFPTLQLKAIIVSRRRQ